MQNHAVQHITSATTLAAIPAPGAKSRITITALHISVAAADVVTVGFSAANQRVFDLAANGSVEIGLTRWEGDANAAFSITTSTAGPADFSADYILENAP